MSIKPGDIFWVSPSDSNRIASHHTHPYVVIPDDTSTMVTVCALTSNLKHAKEPGNVLLDEGEANLSRQSVVVASRVFMVDKTQLGKYIGTLTEQRIHQVLAGMRFVQYMVQHHE
ncbi:MAG TPA: type II toxin-antitoxin system PemK/MazF family toxin [Anaerolineales bacterium]|nr:type II toxin-antitoxin system PemK/MazF family toxin [Anaerolineales bacterium]